MQHAILDFVTSEQNTLLIDRSITVMRSLADLFGGEPGHDAAVEEEVREREALPFTDVEYADHTDVRDDPPLINGRRPDLITENRLTGRRTAVELETHPGTPHDRRQRADLEAGTEALGMGFDYEVVDDDPLKLEQDQFDFRF